MAKVEWKKANFNDLGIETIAFKQINEQLGHYAVVGYNGILKGHKVIYQDKEYTIVMVSKLGDFGLSETGELPYILRVSPSKVKKIGKTKTEIKKEKEFWKTQYLNLKEDYNKFEKEVHIVKNIQKTELISYLETIRDTTSCENTKKYIQNVLITINNS